MKEKIKASAGYFMLSAGLVLLDQMTKQWALVRLRPIDSMTLIDGVIGLRYAENTGAAFSALSNATALLSVFSLVVCAIVAVWLYRRPDMARSVKIPLSMVLAGGVGNLIDRLGRGFVVDMFEVLFIRFAIFNVADICITVGAFILFIALMCGGDERGRVENRR